MFSRRLIQHETETLQVPKASVALFVVTAFWNITNKFLPSTPEAFPAGSSDFSQVETADSNGFDKFFFILIFIFYPPRDEMVSFKNI